MNYYSGVEGSSAYDFALFEPRKTTRMSGGERVERRPAAPGKRQKVDINAPAKRRSRTAANVGARKKERIGIAISKAQVKTVAVVALGLLIVAIVIAGSAQTSKLTRMIEEKNAALVELQQDYEAMSIQHETKMSDSAVEEYAIEVLGMQKRESSQTNYVPLGSGDSFEVATRSDNWIGLLK